MGRLLVCTVCALTFFMATFAAPSFAATCDGHTATVVGTAGPDTLYGGGNTVVDAGAGDDTILNLTGGDIACGDDGYDTFQIAAGAAGMITLDAGGSDGVGGALDLSKQTSGITVNLNNGTASPIGGGWQASLTAFDDVTGSNYADTIIGNANNNYIVAGGGDDTVQGGAGDDVIAARDDGPDTVDCGPGTDIVYTDNQDTVTNCEMIRSPPVCTAQAVTTDYNTPVNITVHCTGYPGSTLVDTVFSPPVHGSASSLSASGQLMYTPTNGFSGTDQFQVIADDGAGWGDEQAATVTVNVSAQGGTGGGGTGGESTGGGTGGGGTGGGGSGGGGTNTKLAPLSFHKPITAGSTVKLAASCPAEDKPHACSARFQITTSVSSGKRTVGSGPLKVPAGKTKDFSLTLNDLGKALLARTYHLHAKLDITGGGKLTKTVNLSYGLLHDFTIIKHGDVSNYRTRFTKFAINGLQHLPATGDYRSNASAAAAHSSRSSFTTRSQPST